MSTQYWLCPVLLTMDCILTNIHSHCYTCYTLLYTAALFGIIIDGTAAGGSRTDGRPLQRTRTDEQSGGLHRGLRHPQGLPGFTLPGLNQPPLPQLHLLRVSLGLRRDGLPLGHVFGRPPGLLHQPGDPLRLGLPHPQHPDHLPAGTALPPDGHCVRSLLVVLGQFVLLHIDPDLHSHYGDHLLLLVLLHGGIRCE